MLSFLLRVLFAEEHDLGYDPTMSVHRTLEDGSRQYDIAVRHEDGICQTFRTKSLLSNGGGCYLHGRGTRVWEAVRLENGMETDELVALKDSWVDGYREREAVVNARIRGSATSSDERDKLDRLMLPIAAHGDVYISGTLDCTRLCSDSKRRITSLLFID